VPDLLCRTPIDDLCAACGLGSFDHGGTGARATPRAGSLGLTRRDFSVPPPLLAAPPAAEPTPEQPPGGRRRTPPKHRGIDVLVEAAQQIAGDADAGQTGQTGDDRADLGPRRGRKRRRMDEARGADARPRGADLWEPLEALGEASGLTPRWGGERGGGDAWHDRWHSPEPTLR
jgi:hypothetical protein